MVRAFTGTAYTAEFWRTGCGDLSSNIQARFEWDVSNGNAMTIKEVGQQTGKTWNNVDGAFKFDEFAQGYYYAANLGLYQYPSIQPAGDLRHYKIYASNLTITAPINGLRNGAVLEPVLNATHTYSANFSTASDEFQIIISQSSTAIVAEYDVINSGGTTLDTWSQTQDLSTVSNPPPYSNYGVSAELDGLESTGYAHILSGTDFQIELVIHPYTATDFTGYQTVSYTQTQQFSEGSPSCFTTYAEDEGTDASYTYGAYRTVQSS